MQDSRINIQNTLMAPEEVRAALGVTRSFLRYHEEWFEPIKIGNRRIYSMAKVWAVYIRHTQSFPKASPEVVQATEKYVKRIVQDARPQ